MEVHGFVELGRGSEASLRRLLSVSCRWGRRKRVFVWSSDVPRPRLRLLVENLKRSGLASQVDLVIPEDRAAAAHYASTATFCLLSTGDFAPHLTPNQVAVYFPSWKAERYGSSVRAVAGD